MNKASNNPNKEHNKDKESRLNGKDFLNHIKEITSSSFPVKAFPAKIQKIIRETNECLNYPVDFIGASLLYSGSIAIGNTLWVEVKNEFQQNACIYIALIGPPGSTKSHPISWALQPILDRDKTLKMQFLQELQRYHNHLEKSKGEQEDIQKPILHKHLISDFTPEALTQAHDNNMRGLGVYVDELATWFNNFNRYNKGDSQTTWLSIFSMKPLNIDRKGSASIFIDKPFVSVGGTIQTRLLYQLAKNNRSDNGFMDRILFAMLDNLKKKRWSNREIDPEISRGWKGVIDKLLDLEYQDDDPTILRYDVDAYKRLSLWQSQLTDLINETNNDYIKGIYSKLELYCIRLSLILEMMYYACGESNKESVSLKSVEGAILLTEYFAKSAIKVNTIINSDNPLDKLPNDKQIFYSALPEEFSTREGIKIANDLGIMERTVFSFFTKKELFEKIERGKYRKLFIT